MHLGLHLIRKLKNPAALPAQVPVGTLLSTVQRTQHVHYARMETKPKQIRETVLFKLSCQRQTTQLKTTPHSIVFPAERISQELPCRGRLLCPRPPPPLGLSLTVIKERRERSQSVMSLQGRLVRFP